ncbi:MAG: hypothetical protein OXC07_10430, partial [Kistimonas sp.]|nr:hypothetical protein [Kistimonas sp.]
SLWIHGVDSQGQLVRKACLRVDTAINGPLAASPDGLSLLLASVEDPPIFLQLGFFPPQENRAGRVQEPVPGER